MARQLHRPQLRAQNLSVLLTQALLSCRSSFGLFLALALLSSVYESAIERAAVIPGIAFSSPNSTFSFQFLLDPSQPAPASQSRPSSEGALPENGRNNRPAQEDSYLSRFWSMVVSSDPFLSEDLKESQVAQPEQFLSVPKEGDAGFSGNGQESSAHKDNKGGRVEGSADDAEVKDLDEEEDHGSARPTDTILYPDDRASATGAKTVTGKGSEQDISASSSSDYGDCGEGVELPTKDVDDADDTFSVIRIKLQTLGNETKKEGKDLVDETSDLMYFTGRLLGGRGLDHGAMHKGGMTVLVMLLILTGALAIFLGVLGFQHAAVLGCVVYSVVSTHMGKIPTTSQAFKAGFKSGMGRLMWLAILHATLRGLQDLVFMKTLFGGVMEMEQIDQLVLRLSETPFAFLAPFRDADATNLGMAVRIGLFVGLAFIFDGVAYCVYVVACWVTILERDFWGLGALTRSWNLVKSMKMQAVAVTALEAVACGTSSSWLLKKFLGQFLATFVICTVEVYFLVLWLIFYFSARSIHDGSSNFSYRQLEDFLDRFR